MSEDQTPRYRTPPFASAGNMVPLGLHVASDGRLAFDPTDSTLEADLRCMIAAFVEMYPAEEGSRPSRFARSVLDIRKQKDRLGRVMSHILRQMAQSSGSSADEYNLDNMLASTFSRFPQFTDFLVLTAGCGDAQVDPEHQDFTLSEELVFNFGEQS